jgi:hypothetical protein
VIVPAQVAITGAERGDRRQPTARSAARPEPITPTTFMRPSSRWAPGYLLGSGRDLGANDGPGENDR